MITLEKTKELLQADNLPGTPDQVKELLETTDELIKENGEKWITDNRHRLLNEWEFVVMNS
jgi:two-component SAPR family response regulator